MKKFLLLGGVIVAGLIGLGAWHAIDSNGAKAQARVVIAPHPLTPRTAPPPAAAPATEDCTTPSTSKPAGPCYSATWTPPAPDDPAPSTASVPDTRTDDQKWADIDTSARRERADQPVEGDPDDNRWYVVATRDNRCEDLDAALGVKTPKEFVAEMGKRGAELHFVRNTHDFAMVAEPLGPTIAFVRGKGACMIGLATAQAADKEQ